MEFFLESFLNQYSGNLRGFIFGFVHVGIMLLGYYSGWSINRFLKIVSNGYIAGIVGAAMSHIIADLIASYLDPHLRTMIIGIVLGGVADFDKKSNLLNFNNYSDRLFFCKKIERRKRCRLEKSGLEL